MCQRTDKCGRGRGAALLQAMALAILPVGLLALGSRAEITLLMCQAKSHIPTSPCLHLVP